MSYLKVSYDKENKPFTSYPKKLIKHICDKFYLKKGKVLDVASGRGEFINEFSELDFESYSIDREDETKLNYQNIFHTKFNYENYLPYDNKFFDIIFCKSFIEHIRDVDTLFKEFNRILKPGGSLIVLTPDWESIYKVFYEDYTHVTPFTSKSLSDIQKVHGFVDISVCKFIQLPIVWKSKFFYILSFLIRHLYPIKINYKYKYIKFSKELMLLSHSIKKL